MSKLKVEVEEDGNLILDGEGTVLDIIKMAGALTPTIEGRKQS